MTTGKINVSVENIFPLIKEIYTVWSRFLRIDFEWYWCHFKIKTPTSIGEAKVEYNPYRNQSIKKVKKFIIDQGLGMTADEVGKYINQVAFSGAEEF
jgi:molecular chaperone HtpG